MLITNTKNAATLYKAGAIYASAGDLGKANELMHNAVAINQYIDPCITNKVKQSLALNKQ